MNKEKKMKKIVATRKAFWNCDAHKLECCLCGEDDRNKLIVEYPNGMKIMNDSLDLEEINE
jgi:hypothetical protein